MAVRRRQTDPAYIFVQASRQVIPGQLPGGQVPDLVLVFPGSCLAWHLSGLVLVRLTLDQNMHGHLCGGTCPGTETCTGPCPGEIIFLVTETITWDWHLSAWNLSKVLALEREEMVFLVTETWD